MADLRDLYQEVIFEHHRRPRNFRVIDSTDRVAEGFNPLCGDRLTVYLDVEDGVIRDASFEGAGCAISVASASLMTETLKGRTEHEAERLFEAFHKVVTGSGDAAGLGKLAALAGVAEFPTRVKCATLAWHTMRAAMKREREAVSTE